GILTASGCRDQSIPATLRRYLDGQFLELESVGEGGAVEHVAGSERHAFEDAADLATGLVLAVFAAPVGDSGEAGERGDRAVDKAQDLAEGHLLRGLEQPVAAAAAAQAHDDAGAFQFEQDLFEELLGDRLFAGDLADHAGAAGAGAGEGDEGAQGVFGLLRDHAGERRNGAVIAVVPGLRAEPWARFRQYSRALRKRLRRAKRPHRPALPRRRRG